MQHSAPTLPGFSGGLFLSSSLEATRGFAGVHVGGSTGVSRNFVILTVNPNFATAYFNAIAIATDYLGMDRTRLQEYYNSHTAILPQGIKDVLGPHFQQGISQFPGGLAFFFYSLILLILQEEGRTQGGREGKEGQDHVKQDATTSNHSCLATDFSFLYYLLYFVTDRSPIPHAAD